MSQKPRRPMPGKPAARKVVRKPVPAASASNSAASEATPTKNVSTPTPVPTSTPVPVSAPTPKKVEETKQVREKPTPKAAPVSPNTEEKEHNNKALPILLIAVIIVLVGVAIYFIAEFRSAKSELDKTSSELADIEKIKDDQLSKKKEELEKILADYEGIKQERSSLGANNKELNSEIEALRNQLYRLNSALQTAKQETRDAQANAGNNNDAPAEKRTPKKRTRMSTADKTKFAQQMDDLIATHKVALEARDKEIKKLKHINTHLSSQLNTLEEKHGQLVGNLSTLEERISAASQLYIENFKIGYKNPKGNVEYDELNEFKAKKIDQIKVGFSIADNKITEKGYKNFKLKLVDPAGTVLFDSGHSGGSFESDEGTQLYTSEKDIKFDNELEEVNFFFVQSAEYKKGEYQAVIFADSKKVGEKRFTIQ